MTTAQERIVNKMKRIEKYLLHQSSPTNYDAVYIVERARREIQTMTSWEWLDFISTLDFFKEAIQ